MFSPYTDFNSKIHFVIRVTNNVGISMVEISKTTSSTGLYEAAIGERNQAYYLDKFEQFDEKGDGFHISWNWAAFFFSGFWALSRKMYRWFFAMWAFAVIVNMVEKLNVPPAVGLLFLAPGLCFAIFGNSLYHRKVKAQIASAQKSDADELKVIRRLNSSGGVHTWVLYVVGVIPVIGIVAAIAIPAFQNTAKFDSSTAKPWDKYSSNDNKQTQEAQWGKNDKLAPVETDWANGTITPPLQVTKETVDWSQFEPIKPTQPQLTPQNGQIDAFLNQSPKVNPFDQFDKAPRQITPPISSSVAEPTPIPPKQSYKPSKVDLQEIANAKAQEIQANAKQAQVNSDLQAIANRAIRDYPYLDTPEGQRVLDLITAKRDVYIRQGVYPSIALTRAVNDFAPAYAPQAVRRTPQVAVEAPTIAAPTVDSQGCGWVSPTEWKCKQ